MACFVGCEKKEKIKPETEVMSFKPEEKIQQVAQAYALDAIDVAERNFNISLDWSDESVEQVESMLDELHQQISVAKPSQDQIQTFSKMFGSYIGEVYRKNHDGEWGLIESNGTHFPGMKTKKTGTTFWPWGRVLNRINNGSEDNVWHYYKVLTEEK